MPIVLSIAPRPSNTKKRSGVLPNEEEREQCGDDDSPGQIIHVVVRLLTVAFGSGLAASEEMRNGKKRVTGGRCPKSVRSPGRSIQRVVATDSDVHTFAISALLTAHKLGTTDRSRVSDIHGIFRRQRKVGKMR